MLKIANIWKTYQGALLLRGISLRLETGKTACLLGPSGSGKSTLLRIIAGLETPDQGSIYWQDEDLKSTPVHQRGFGLMFQDYALFPHRTVRQNVSFGLRMQGLPGAEVEQRTTDALRQVNMTGFGSRRVTDLSGGEQQRVALARALAPRPRLLMLDEPLGALDRTLREELLVELRSLLRETGITAIYVTHDQEEAFYMADRLILLHEGQVVQEGTPASVYACPVTPWAAGFFGMSNLLDGTIVSLDPLVVATKVGKILGTPVGELSRVGGKATVLLKPGGISWRTGDGCANCIQGVVRDVIFREEGYRISLEFQGKKEFTFHSGTAFSPGQTLGIELPVEVVLVYPV